MNNVMTKPVCQDDSYQLKGSIWTNGVDTYMYCQISQGEFRLINLESGNRMQDILDLDGLTILFKEATITVEGR